LSIALQMPLTVFRSCRLFLADYLCLAQLSKINGFQWFLPGFVHPLQAMMILLLHLTHCANLPCEESLQSMPLLAQVFELVGNRLQQGRVVSSNVDAAESQGRSDKANLIYCLLAKLRYRVWKRAGWQNSSASAGPGCPLENITQAIKFARSDEYTEQQGPRWNSPDNGHEPPSVEHQPGFQPLEEIELDQYEDLFNQYLQPGVME